jgi:hypothetical protein
MGYNANRNERGPSSCAAGTGTSGPAGSSRYGLALRLIRPERAQQRKRDLATVDDLVLRDLVE